MAIVACPNCKAEVVWSTKCTSKPFCSERCRLIDLGAWILEEHKISEHQSLPDIHEITDEEAESLMSKINIEALLKK